MDSCTKFWLHGHKTVCVRPAYSDLPVWCRSQRRNKSSNDLHAERINKKDFVYFWSKDPTLKDSEISASASGQNTIEQSSFLLECFTGEPTFYVTLFFMANGLSALMAFKKEKCTGNLYHSFCTSPNQARETFKFVFAHIRHYLLIEITIFELLR